MLEEGRVEKSMHVETALVGAPESGHLLSNMSGKTFMYAADSSARFPRRGYWGPDEAQLSERDHCC